MWLTKGLSYRTTLNHRSVLHGSRKEGRAIDFFPEIESGVVPVLRDIGEIVGYNGPDQVGSHRLFPLLD